MLGLQFELVQTHQKEIGIERKVFEQEGDFYCLIETGGSNGEHDEAVRILPVLGFYLAYHRRNSRAFLNT